MLLTFFSVSIFLPHLNTFESGIFLQFRTIYATLNILSMMLLAVYAECWLLSSLYNFQYTHIQLTKYRNNYTSDMFDTLCYRFYFFYFLVYDCFFSPCFFSFFSSLFSFYLFIPKMVGNNAKSNRCFCSWFFFGVFTLILYDGKQNGFLMRKNVRYLNVFAGYIPAFINGMDGYGYGS